MSFWLIFLTTFGFAILITVLVLIETWREQKREQRARKLAEQRLALAAADPCPLYTTDKFSSEIVQEFKDARGEPEGVNLTEVEILSGARAVTKEKGCDGVGHLAGHCKQNVGGEYCCQAIDLNKPCPCRPCNTCASPSLHDDAWCRRSKEGSEKCGSDEGCVDGCPHVSPRIGCCSCLDGDDGVGPWFVERGKSACPSPPVDEHVPLPYVDADHPFPTPSEKDLWSVNSHSHNPNCVQKSRCDFYDTLPPIPMPPPPQSPRSVGPVSPLFGVCNNQTTEPSKWTEGPVRRATMTRPTTQRGTDPPCPSPSPPPYEPGDLPVSPSDSHHYQLF